MKLSKTNSRQTLLYKSDTQARAQEIEITVCANLDFLFPAKCAPQNIGIAVSGGSDSLSLLLIAQSWSNGSPHTLFAATVDHGLRPEAADEAVYVGDICKKIGITHNILKWNPSSGMATQSQARLARHTLLVQWCNQNKINTLLVGHTRDDRLETLLMRENSGSSDFGLAAMPLRSPSPIWPEGQDLSLARPLIQCQRQDLETCLIARKTDWVIDPSNDNDTYERVRVRKSLLNLSKDEHDTLVHRLKTLSEDRQNTLTHLQTASTEHVRWRDDGSAHLNRTALAHLEPDLCARLLEKLILCVSGADNAPHLARMQKLTTSLLSDHKTSTHCLGGCWIKRDDNSIRIYAMPRKRATSTGAPQKETGTLTIQSGTTRIFDNRYRIHLSPHAQSASIVTWDEANYRNIANLPGPEDKMARRSYPVLLTMEDNIAIPSPLPPSLYAITPLHAKRFQHLTTEEMPAD